MNLTVDAGIVVKWLVAEPMHDEARLLLGRRIRLHAPDFMLAECANVLWKKTRRREVADPGPYLRELAALSDVVDLRPVRDLVDRAAQIALEADHPVYDCLYLACAEFTDSGLVTGDRRLADKAAQHLAGTRVHRIGAPGVAERLEAAATAPVIGRDEVEALIAAHDVFEKTERSVLDAVFGESRELRVPTAADWELFMNSPSYRRLVDLVHGLDVEKRTDLLALGWLGTGRFPDWRQSLSHAEKAAAGLDAKHAAGYGRGWRAGYARMTGERG